MNQAPPAYKFVLIKLYAGGAYLLAETTTTTTSTTDVTTVVTAVDETTSATTTTTTNQRTNTLSETTETTEDNLIDCNNCGNIDLRKLAEESRCAAFRSSNIAAATSNSVVIFTMLILQEILIKECKKGTFDLDSILLISNAISNLSAGIVVVNPQPLNS
ncbi:MAG: hypothetical protein H6Q70_1696 [Firmicutes bacterium]|nr:hypothetical protein [Bacillota bacterium]